MKIKLSVALLSMLFFGSLPSVSAQDKHQAINSGVGWFDQHNRPVNAHGACIVKEGGLYYLFGEYKSDTSNAFEGFGCYSSTDLMNWKFEKVVLGVQKDGILGPERVGERVKVMKCPSTGEFVMYMHCDDMKYNDPHVGYATCKTINGDYQFHGDLLHQGEYLRKWDLGTFQDNDGKGYLLTHEGFIYRLSPDYKSVEKAVVSEIAPGGESPAMFRSGGYYFWLFSNKTSWERNDNYYLTSTSLEGPWTRIGNFAPQGTLTWNSQSSFVLPVIAVSDTLHMYMGDRWSFPKQGSAATYVWQPITVQNGRMSIPQYCEGWRLDKANRWHPVSENLKPTKGKIQQKGHWDVNAGVFRSNEKGSSVTIPFTGSRVAVNGISNNTSGYARVIIMSSTGEQIINTVVDFYSKYEYSSRKFISPSLAPGRYVISIEVMGEYPTWSDKRFSRYGSTDNYIAIEGVFCK